MKIAIINYTGGVGKTTIAAQLLSPRMQNAPILAIETINQTAQELGITTQQLSGENFRMILRTLIKEDDVIVDVGASNIEAFIEGMVRFDNSHQEFDYFVIPVTSGTKEQKETISLLTVLRGMDVPAEKVKIVFNRVAHSVTEEFSPLVSFIDKEQICTYNLDAAIFENEVFDLLNVKKLSIATVLADNTNYREKAREAHATNDTKQANHYTDLHLVKALAIGVNRHLDVVYKALFN